MRGSASELESACCVSQKTEETGGTNEYGGERT